jgi:hypothetical protein
VATDWQWCYENPQEAAREIDKLQSRSEQWMQAWSDICNETQEHLNEIAKLKATVEKFQRIMLHAQADKFGVYFICGGSAVEADGLPAMIHVCPSYGLDRFAVYRKTSPYS